MPRVDDEQSGAWMEAAWAEFESPTAWKRSQKGNIWREWAGRRCVIFRRRDGRYGWSIADEEEVRFSPCSYATEDGARTALGEAVGVGW
jgi:hypothetical protein